MKKIIILLVVFVGLAFAYEKFPGGISRLISVVKVGGPSAETQREIVLMSMKEAMVVAGSGMTLYAGVLRVNESEIKYEIHPVVKKTIDGTQYDAWPISVKGSGIVQTIRNPVYIKSRRNHLVDTEYTLYYYVDSVGKSRCRIEGQANNVKRI